MSNTLFLRDSSLEYSEDGILDLTRSSVPPDEVLVLDDGEEGELTISAVFTKARAKRAESPFFSEQGAPILLFHLHPLEVMEKGCADRIYTY